MIDTRTVARNGGYLAVRAFDPDHAPSVPLSLHARANDNVLGLVLALV